MEVAPPAVVTPPLDLVAAEDGRSAQRLDRLLRARRTEMLGFAVLGALVAIPLALRISAGVNTTVLFLVVLLLAVVAVLGFPLRTPKGWREVLAEGPWRPVSAVLDRSRWFGSVVLFEGRLWRVSQYRSPWRIFVAELDEMVTATGHLWVVGDGAAGPILARVDGSGQLYALTPLRGKASVVPAVPWLRKRWKVSAVGALSGPITFATAARVTAQRSVVLTAPLLLAFWYSTAFPVLLDSGLAAPVVAVDVAYWIGLGFVVLGAALVVGRNFAWWWRGRSVRLLLKRGPWFPVPARLETEASGVITWVDRSEVRVELHDPSADLLDNVRLDGRLWFAGVPVHGERLAVGVPGQPVIGVVVVGTRA